MSGRNTIIHLGVQGRKRKVDEKKKLIEVNRPRDGVSSGSICAEDVILPDSRALGSDLTVVILINLTTGNSRTTAR